MASRIILICDRCGREYNQDVRFGKICFGTTVTICNVVAVTHGSEEWDLCPSCAEKLKDFLYEGSES